MSPPSPSSQNQEQIPSRRTRVLMAWARVLLPYLLVLAGALVVVVRPECAPYVDEVHRQLPLVIPMAPVVPGGEPGAPCDPTLPGHDHEVEAVTPELAPPPPPPRPGDGALLPAPPFLREEESLVLHLRASCAPRGAPEGARPASSTARPPFARSQGLSGAGDVPRSLLESSPPRSTLAAARRRTRS